MMTVSTVGSIERRIVKTNMPLEVKDIFWSYAFDERMEQGMRSHG